MTTERTLQQQVHERLVKAILQGALKPHEPLPSSRELSEQFGVSRNTVVLVYQRLVDDGYLTPVPRRGHFINEQYIKQQLSLRGDTRTASLFEPEQNAGIWEKRFAIRPTAWQNITKPANWRDYPYPFIYGQVIPDKISAARWRDCSRFAGTSRHVAAWVTDQVDSDDPILVEQILTQILPGRGIKASPEEVIVTVGAQNAIYLVACLLTQASTVVGIESPGYVDAFNIFRSTGASLKPLRIDASGLVLGQQLDGCDLIYVTPSHQAPTSVTLGLDRRLKLIEQARADDFLILEDDYEHELNYLGAPHAALKSYDNADRVIHVGSLTKTLFPGLRLGFIVAPRAVISELRALRRLMYRHPSALDQRAMAIFIAEGHLDGHIRRARTQLAAKWSLMLNEISRRMPEIYCRETSGGSSLWLTLPKGVESWTVQKEAARRGVLIEPGDVHFLGDLPERRSIRAGFAAIDKDKIATGIGLLAEAIAASRQ
ncbi:HTH-type transcriptional regulatory protein GabR [Hartmannibacter diazotrophicus]|uniref:HTH-type transcriptional regulatory protein GabR n=2 Tax=Hartmannibacter diazotrophicus TaxID=1482074 RepID=A0A2C9D9F2_9HYPH|nr:HTH-type transcriptional regulatory protein GabR [Hartmannibacter diazotrophicus]